MDSRRVQRGTERIPVRSEVITDDEMAREGEYDDVWPVRQHSSTRHYQGAADVNTEAGRSAADVQTATRRRGHARVTEEPRSIPPRRSATQARLPALPKTPPAGGLAREGDELPPPSSLRGSQQRPLRETKALFRRFHWTFFLGLSLMVMVLGWVALSALGSWWTTTLDDWHYGRPRTFQIDAVVGHRDSPQHPSHFIALNLNRHIIVLEIPGGDVSKSVVYNGPTLLGQGQDLTPVTLSFQDVNRDKRPDMLVNVQGNLFVFLNANGTFVPATQNIST